jgi:hypothetical protein
MRLQYLFERTKGPKVRSRLKNFTRIQTLSAKAFLVCLVVRGGLLASDCQPISARNSFANARQDAQHDTVSCKLRNAATMVPWKTPEQKCNQIASNLFGGQLKKEGRSTRSVKIRNN